MQNKGQCNIIGLALILTGAVTQQYKDFWEVFKNINNIIKEIQRIWM